MGARIDVEELTQAPRKKTQRERFRDAFWAELDERPGRAPGPTALLVRMGRKPPKNHAINGDLSRLRQQLLVEAGFTKDPVTGYWYLTRAVSRLVPRLQWRSCSSREFGPSGDRRHLVQSGGLTTLCGYSATHPDIWRLDRMERKPKCEQCLVRGNDGVR